MCKQFEVPSILQALREDVLAGMITIQEASETLCSEGWMNFVDEAKTLRLLHIKEG